MENGDVQKRKSCGICKELLYGVSLGEKLKLKRRVEAQERRRTKLS
jgi:hypothetical protein